MTKINDLDAGLKAGTTHEPHFSAAWKTRLKLQGCVAHAALNNSAKRKPGAWWGTPFAPHYPFAAPGTAIADPVWFFSLAIFIRQAAG